MEIDLLLKCNTAMSSVVVDRIEVLYECGRYEDAISETIEMLNRSVFFDEYKTGVLEKSRAAVADKMRLQLSPSGRDRKCNFLMNTELSLRVFQLLVESLVELNWCGGEFTMFWTAFTSLSSEHFSAIIKLLVLGVLSCNDYGGKCMALLARASARGKQMCSTILTEGALPCVVAVITLALSRNNRQNMSGQAEESALNYLCCNGCVILANLIRFLSSKLMSELVLATNAHLHLIRLTCSGWESIVGEQEFSPGHINCSREGVQALANLAVLANDRVWRELLSSKCVTAFSGTVRFLLEVM
jgi:hypothetical protein